MGEGRISQEQRSGEATRGAQVYLCFSSGTVNNKRPLLKRRQNMGKDPSQVWFLIISERKAFYILLAKPPIRKNYYSFAYAHTFTQFPLDSNLLVMENKGLHSTTRLCPLSSGLETAGLSCLWASLSTAFHRGGRNEKQRKDCLALSFFSSLLYDLPRNPQSK